MDKKMVEQLLLNEEAQKRNPSPLWSQLRREYEKLCGLENELAENVGSAPALRNLKATLKTAESHQANLQSDISAQTAENEGERKRIQADLDALEAEVLQWDEKIRQVEEGTSDSQKKILQAEQRKPMRDALLAKKMELTAESDDLQQKIDALGAGYEADMALLHRLEPFVEDLKNTESQMNALLEEIWGEKVLPSRDAFDRMEGTLPRLK